MLSRQCAFWPSRDRSSAVMRVCTTAVVCLVAIVPSSLCGASSHWAATGNSARRAVRATQLAFAPHSVGLRGTRRGKSRLPKASRYISPQGLAGLRMADSMALPPRLQELAQWIGASKDNKDAGLRLVKLGDDFAAAHGERLSQSDQQEAAKVPGCVSVVRIRVSLQEDSLGTGLEVRGDADARVARGMLALLAKGLRGAGLEEVMALDARQLIRTAKLDQFLPPGRNDGLSSMLAVIKQEAAALPSDDTASVLQAQAGSPQGSAGQSDDGKARAGQDSSMVEAEDVSASNAVSQVWAFGGRAEEVAMLLSGGVDSSVAMALLKDQGYKVTAFYLKIWLEDELAHLGECPWEDDWHYASSVARDLSIPLEAVSLQREYWDQVVKYLIDESARGRTPNPDIMCNSRIKFGMFHDYVGKHFSAIASGHYARQQVCEQTGRAQLCMSPDAVKDQTYFLCNMNQDQVSHARFPLGALQKSQVRELAHKYSLATESRKDSQGICFLGKLKFEDFVGHHLGENPGPVHEFGSNRLIGEHRGLWFYTIGQRKGLGGATRQFTHEGPWFVAGKNVDSNTLLVTNQYHLIEAPRRAFEVEDINWIAGAPPEMQGGALDLRVKTRHGPNMHDCVLEVSGEARRQGHVKLAGRDSGLAPGQWAAFYRGEECLGGGVIGEGSFTPRREEGRHEPDVGGPLGASEAAAQGADRLAHEVLFMEDS